MLDGTELGRCPFDEKTLSVIYEQAATFSDAYARPVDFFPKANIKLQRGDRARRVLKRYTCRYYCSTCWLLLLLMMVYLFHVPQFRYAP